MVNTLTAMLMLSSAILHFANPAVTEQSGNGYAEVSEGLQKEIDMFEAMVHADPKNISLHYTAGMLFQLAGQHQQVCDHLYEAYILDPAGAHPELLFHLANNLKAIGENQAAVDFYSLAIGAHPIGPVNWVLISISLDFVGRPLDAVRGYETVLRLGPTARIESWVEIYMLSSLAKVGMWRRALYRYHRLVGALTPPPPHSSTHAPALTSAQLPSPSSGWIKDAAKERVIQLGLVSRSLESAPSFVHAARQHAEAWRANGPQWHHDADAAWVRREIERRQAPAGGCASARVLIVELGRQDGKTGKIGTEIHGFGLGAQMHVLSVALSYAFRTERVLVTRQQDNWWYTDKEACPSRSFECYFDPVSACTEGEVMASLAGEQVEKLTAASEGRRVVYSDCRLDNFLNTRENRVYVPEKLTHRGLLWWRAQLVSYLIRPNLVLQRLLDKDLAMLGLEAAPMVGVHVRHGDKKTESSVVPMDHYLDAALQLLYVSTDDPIALAEARAWAARAGEAGRGRAHIVARDGEVRGVSTATDQVVQMHRVNATRYGEEAIVNLLLMARAEAFVGTFSSNFGRLAFELAYARQSGRVFPVSMDVFWHAYP